MKRLGPLRRLATLAVVLCTLVLGSPPPLAQAATAPDATCTGSLPAGTYHNVTVPQNAACTLGGANVIQGNVVAQAGSDLTILATHIAGSVQDQYGTSLSIAPILLNGTYLLTASIGGDLRVAHVKYLAIGTGHIFGNLPNQPGGIGGVYIGGNVQDQYGGVLDVRDASIGGSLQVAHLTAVPTAYCPPSSDGQVVCGRNPDVSVSNTTVAGDGQFSDNLAALGISSNRFGGNLLLKNTTTPDCGCFPKTAEVVSNQIGNDLDCENNQPPPISFGNFARHNRGQCLA